MREWVRATVGEVTVYQRAGGTPTATDDSLYGGDIPFVTIEDITNGTRFLDRTEKNLSEKGLKNSAAWLIKEPHILYSMYATVGKPIINRIACATNQAIIALKESNEIEQPYLFYQLLFIRPDVYKFTSQTTQSNLNAGSVKRLPISYPKDKAEQRKVASILASIDTAIEKTEALIEKYQQIKAGLMHDLFTRGILPNGQLRPPREQAPELYQETAIGCIPKEWRIGALVDFADVHNNLRKPLASEVRESIKGPYPYYGPTGVLDYINEYLVEGEFCLIGEDGDHFLKFQKWPMTQLVSGRFNVNNHAHLLTGKNDVSTEWVYEFFKHRDITFHLTRQGAGRYKLNKASLLKLPIYAPTSFEQSEIITRLDAFGGHIEAQNTTLAKLRDQKLGLMQDLLTGKVQVKVDASAKEAAHA